MEVRERGSTGGGALFAPNELCDLGSTGGGCPDPDPDPEGEGEGEPEALTGARGPAEVEIDLGGATGAWPDPDADPDPDAVGVDVDVPAGPDEAKGLMTCSSSTGSGGGLERGTGMSPSRGETLRGDTTGGDGLLVTPGEDKVNDTPDTPDPPTATPPLPLFDPDPDPDPAPAEAVRPREGEGGERASGERGDDDGPDLGLTGGLAGLVWPWP